VESARHVSDRHFGSNSAAVTCTSACPVLPLSLGTIQPGGQIGNFPAYVEIAFGVSNPLAGTAGVVTISGTYNGGSFTSTSGDLQLSQSFDPNPGGNLPQHEPSPEAHELYLRGAEAWNAATLDSFRKGAALFQAAASRDPQFAEAWLGLANTHWNLGIFSGWSEVSVAQVESEARRALDANPHLASAHATLGQISWRHDFNWPRAETEFRIALQYGNGTYNVHNLYAICLGERGRFAESHRHFRTAQELSPLQDARTYRHWRAHLNFHESRMSCGSCPG